ncbi:MAG: DUF2064 domain-containing protein [Acidobacteriota bacterium]
MSLREIRGKAILVFADPISLDLTRRKWPGRFACLLRLPDLKTALGAEADVHFFTSPTGVLSANRSGPGGLHPQRGCGFGERLQNAVEDLTSLGYEQIVIVGRDCPDLNAGDIRRALKLLQNHRVTFLVFRETK